MSDYFWLRFVNLLISEFIEECCNRNFDWFDFNPSGGHEGVSSFKQSFGAKPWRSPIVDVEKRYAYFANKLRYMAKV